MNKEGMYRSSKDGGASSASARRQAVCICAYLNTVGANKDARPGFLDSQEELSGSAAGGGAAAGS